MTWEEFYDNYYDWAESTAIKKLSSVDKLGNSDEVAEIISDLLFNHKDVCNRIARKAIEQMVVFTWNNFQDTEGCIDDDLQKQLLMKSYSAFSKEDLEDMEGYIMLFRMTALMKQFLDLKMVYDRKESTQWFSCYINR